VKGRRGWLCAAGFAALCAAAAVAGLTGCGKKPEPQAGSSTAAPATAPGQPTFSVLASSEVRDLEATLLQAAQAAGVPLKLSYAGTLDIVERVNGGERFDAILPASGAYPALALTTKPLARDKLFYSRVALGVKAAKLKALGWDARNPSWADIAKAAGAGQLRYAMTNPTSSNTGMSALFAVSSAVAGKTEDLSAQEVNGDVLKAFLSGQTLTAGSSGWLAEAFVKEAAGLDAMVNYEAVILRTNEKLAVADRLSLVYPQDGVISADYPLMLLAEDKREDYTRLVAALKAAPVQRELAARDFLRPSVADVPLAAGLGTAAVAELSFPNRLEVIDAVLGAYQGQWRRPATSIFVLDLSGSMEGERLRAMREALKVLAGADAQAASARYARFQSRERVALLAFSDRVDDPVEISFETQAIDAARSQVIAYADGLRVRGGTAIYAALLRAQELARIEGQKDTGRLISIVLLTDGENNVGPDFKAFQQQLAGSTPARVFPILFGEASPGDMAALAQLTGGRVFDGRRAALAQVFKEIRGYQ
jgi:Ca-activated chloride channel family protein